jgi:adenine-specific DNA-methyltransferase
MAKPHYHEAQFFNALREIFVGAEIEGDSGFINLMQIKSRYYSDGVFPHLQSDIDAAVADFPEFREELFDKLYTFFQRYFSESGSIYFRYTPLHQKVYEQVYTNEQDVVLFWKTHMLYYVKTDRIFKSLKVTVDGVEFYFDAANIEHKRANEKRQVIFSLREVAQDGTLVFDCEYSTRGKITKNDEILRELRKADIDLLDETLENAFRVFEKQSEVDYFINKNARSFLEEQFDLWMYQYLFAEKNIWSAERLAQLQTLKEIATKVIGFISQFEDELVKIWNKPKFVRGSHYIVTLDHLMEKDGLLETLFADPGMAAQMGEWAELGFLEEGLDPKELLRQVQEADLTGAPTHPRWAFLPLDTRHFPGLELEILGYFEDLDEMLDGWLIHSENYQALNSLKNKYDKKIQAVYIDPPYNSESTEILYENTYRHSAWLSLIENRLKESQSYTTESGSHIIAIDENEQENLGLLLEKLFSNHDITCISVIHNKKGIQGDYFSYNHDFAYFCIPFSLEKINDKPIPKDEWEYVNLRKWGNESKRITAKNCFYPIFVRNKKIIRFGDVCDQDFHPESNNVKIDENTYKVYPIDSSGVERKWRYSRQSVDDINHLLKVNVTNSGEIQILKAKNKNKFKTVWDDPTYIAGDYGTRLLTDLGINPEENLYPKSVFTVQDSIYAVSSQGSKVLDYFAGSGTTAHAVMNLNRQDGGRRKYILVEMGDHFHDVILPRIKKVAFCSKWKDGQPVFDEGESGMRQFVKYYSLESYEEALQKVHYEDADLFDDPSQDPYHSYVFLRDKKLLESVEADLEADQVRFHPERLYPDIDLAETLSHLTGKWIKGISEDYVEFEDGQRMSLSDPDWATLKPMVWWR